MINQEPRLVKVTRRFWNYETKKYYTDRPETKKGTFHGFCQEGEGGEMECRAIFESEDGTVETVGLQDLVFLEPWLKK